MGVGWGPRERERERVRVVYMFEGIVGLGACLLFDIQARKSYLVLLDFNIVFCRRCIGPSLSCGWAGIELAGLAWVGLCWAKLC